MYGGRTFDHHPDNAAVDLSRPGHTFTNNRWVDSTTDLPPDVGSPQVSVNGWRATREVRHSSLGPVILITTASGRMRTGAREQRRGAAMMPSPPSVTDGQFVISARATAPTGRRPDIQFETLETIAVEFRRPLGFRRILDERGELVGAVLGRPIGLDKEMVPGEAISVPGVSKQDIVSIVERIHELAGQYAIIIDNGDSARLYLDPGGSLSTVFDRRQGRAGSTAAMLLEPRQYAERFRDDLFRGARVARDGWLPAGLTAHDGIERVLPNHYLDLSSWVQVRHWPAGRIAERSDPDVACLEIMNVVRNTIATMRRRGAVAVALTAGNDTRLLLSACRDMTDEIDFVTVDGGSRLDRDTAAALAARFGLRHRILTQMKASPEQAQEWLARTGHCVGGPNMLYHPSIAALRGRGCFVGGVGGEVGRGFFWRPTDKEPFRLTAEGLVGRFGLPGHPDMHEAVAAWLASLEGLDPLQQLDLAYIEHRLGCWAFAQAYANPGIHHVYPLVSRFVFEAALSLPVAWRASDRMVTRSIELTWPELLEIPRNRYGDWRDKKRLVMRATKKPYLVARWLRKRFG
jgi:hypothetical protein